MHFFNASQQPWAIAKPPVASLPVQPRVEAQDLETKPETCGWYDSSFDLAAGLEISEQDDDLMYQLCQLFLH
jgi:hypothetical protein